MEDTPKKSELYYLLELLDKEVFRTRELTDKLSSITCRLTILSPREAESKKGTEPNSDTYLQQLNLTLERLKNTNNDFEFYFSNLVRSVG